MPTPRDTERTAYLLSQGWTRHHRTWRDPAETGSWALAAAYHHAKNQEATSAGGTR